MNNNTKKIAFTVVFILLAIQLAYVIATNNALIRRLAAISRTGGATIEVSVSEANMTTDGDIDEDTLDNAAVSYGSYTDVDELMDTARNFEFRVGRVGGTFNYAHTADAKTFNLILNKESITCDKLVCCYDFLLRRNPFTQELEPNLVESWELSDDGLVCDIHLRKDVRFHDGHPLTADDVVFTYNDLLDNKDIDVGGKGALIFRDWNEEKHRIDEMKMKVEKIDDYTVRFTFPFKTFRAMDRIAEKLIYPKHILKKYVDEGTFNTTWDVSTDPKEIIGSGMYRPWEYFPGERFVVKRNPDYWKKDSAGNSLPYIDKIVFHTIVNHDTQILRFLAGDLDFISLSGEDVAILKDQQEEKGFTIFGTGPNTTVRYFAFNQNFGSDPSTGKPYLPPHKLKWFTNVKFRKAMSYALDRRTWINNFMNGFGVPLYGPLSPASSEFYNPNLIEYKFDLDKAGALLDEIGYIDRDNDGVREDPDGNDISFTILTRSMDEKTQRPVNMFCSDLRKIGVKALPVVEQASTFLDSVWTNHTYECAQLGELTGMEVDGIKQLFASFASYRHYKPNYTEDYTPVAANMENMLPWEEEIDKLYLAYEKELDRGKRKLLGYRIQEILNDQLPIIFTVTNDRVFAIRNKWVNFAPTTSFNPSVWRNFEYMYDGGGR